MGLKVVSARIIKVIEFNPKLRAIRFIPENGSPANYQPGDFLYVRVPAEKEPTPSTIRSISGKQEIRAYSLSSSPTQPFYEITVVEKENKPHVSHLLQYVKSGSDRLEISDGEWIKHGKITLHDKEAEQGRLLLIGGGTGIAPFIGMARYIKDKSFNSDVWLLGSFRSTEHLIFHDEMVDIADKFPNIKYHPTLTRHHNDSWKWGRGRFVLRNDKGIIIRNFFSEIPEIRGYTVYVCGLKAMVNDTKEALEQAGVKTIKAEAWD